MTVPVIIVISLAALALALLYPRRASAHCDTMDGPVIDDGRLALEHANPNHALKWVASDAEEELREVFDRSGAVRDLNPAARDLADRYFLENLVRIHRAGEGALYDGLNPSGAVVDAKVVAADQSVDTGTLAPLIPLVAPEQVPELERRFARVLEHADYDVDDVDAGRAYIEAYVDFFKFAEGEDHDHAHHHGHAAHHH